MFYQLQVTFEGVSGVPSGRYVNNFHFEGPAVPSAGEWTTLFEEMVDFYTDTPDGGTNPLLYYMSEEIANNGHTMKVYELPAVPPRLPVASAVFSMVVDNTITPLPSEVACCLSSHGDITAGTFVGEGPHLPARHRNRVYIGPLNINALEVMGGNVPRPRTIFREDLCFAAGDLMDNLALIDDGWHWAIWSPTRADGEWVRGGYVDDAFDTQRRRGTEPTSKLYFGTTP